MDEQYKNVQNKLLPSRIFMLTFLNLYITPTIFYSEARIIWLKYSVFYFNSMTGTVSSIRIMGCFDLVIKYF